MNSARPGADHDRGKAPTRTATRPRWMLIRLIQGGDLALDYEPQRVEVPDSPRRLFSAAI